jgi:hypothetical protein
MDVSFEQGRAHHVPSKFITDSIAIGWGDIPHFKKKHCHCCVQCIRCPSKRDRLGRVTHVKMLYIAMLISYQGKLMLSTQDMSCKSSSEQIMDKIEDTPYTWNASNKINLWLPYIIKNLICN